MPGLEKKPYFSENLIPVGERPPQPGEIRGKNQTIIRGVTRRISRQPMKEKRRGAVFSTRATKKICAKF